MGKKHEVFYLESSKDTQSLLSNHFFIEQKVDIKLMKTEDKLKEWGPAGRATETTSTHISYNLSGKSLTAPWDMDFCGGTVYHVLQKDFKYSESNSSDMKDKANL